MRSGLHSRLAAVRQERGLTQEALAERAGTSRQSLSSLEGGRSVPSTAMALRLAQALGCRVEDLFTLDEPGGLLVAEVGGRARAGRSSRAALVSLAGRWVAHPISPGDHHLSADGTIVSLRAGSARVRMWRPVAELRGTVAVAGCAPILGILAARTSARVLWLERSSGAALELLRRGQIHVAGTHMDDDELRRALAGRAALVVHLARWEAGLVLAAGNPRRVRTPGDLAGLRIVRREPGAAAERLLARVLARAGVGAGPGPVARGHMDVARAVALGAADCGMAIRAAALAHRLAFLPLAEERFDLVVPRELVDHPPVARLLDALASAAFRREVDSLGGYVAREAGRVVAEVAA